MWNTQYVRGWKTVWTEMEGGKLRAERQRCTWLHVIWFCDLHVWQNMRCQIIYRYLPITRQHLSCEYYLFFMLVLVYESKLCRASLMWCKNKCWLQDKISFHILGFSRNYPFLVLVIVASLSVFSSPAVKQQVTFWDLLASVVRQTFHIF